MRTIRICHSNTYVKYHLKTEGGRWKMRVEDKWLKNAIFHPFNSVIIKQIDLKRWKMEDRKSFFAGEGISNPESERYGHARG
ncbi:hypothetical protein FDF36_14610 [Bacteroides fragilis]|nr:hypothetical protein [Bacteroides fragilis]